MKTPDHDDAFWDGPAETLRASTGTGILRAGVDDRSIVCCTVRGKFELAMARRIMKIADEVVAGRGSVLMFAQWHGMESYEQACRTSMTNWAVSLGPKLAGVHIVVGKALVRMGVTVASMFVVQLHSHDTIESFLREYEEARTRSRSTTPAV